MVSRIVIVTRRKLVVRLTREGHPTCEGSTELDGWIVPLSKGRTSHPKGKLADLLHI